MVSTDVEQGPVNASIYSEALQLCALYNVGKSLPPEFCNICIITQMAVPEN